jgi:site-specific recombinase XerD
MRGIEEYELKYKNKIEEAIKNNPDKPYLRGFYNFMGSRLSVSTKNNYVYYAISFIDFCKKDVRDLELDDYTNFLSQIEDKTSSYQIGVYSGLKKFAKYLVASKKANDNPMDHIERPKFVERDTTIAKREIGYLDKREIKKYLSTTKNGAGSSRAKARQENWRERDLLIVLLFLNTGMRCSALYKLDVDSIDFENNILTSNEKGDKVRTYDLNENLMINVKNWLEKRKEILGDTEETALFISNQKTRMNQTTIARVVKKYSTEIPNKNISPHKLRATYGTQLLKETNNIYFVQECMGHSNPKTTELYIRGEKNINSKKASDIMSKITM